MKRWILLVLLVPLGAVPRWCGDWEFGAEALYWRPCTCSFEFAAKQNQSSGSTTKANVGVMPDYDWGVRVFLGYLSEDECNFAKFDWTYMRISDAKSVTGDPIRAIGFAGDFERVDGRLRHRYNRVNLRFGHRFYEGCRVGLFAYAGGRFVDIHRRERVRPFRENQWDSELRGRTKFTGGGFELGFKGTYDLGCGFGVAGNLGGLAILGRQKLDLSKKNAKLTQTALVQFNERTQCALGVDVRGGINYCFRVCWFKFLGEIGYELNYYFDALVTYPTELNVNVTDLTGSPATPCMNAGFGGLYLSLRMYF